MKKKAAVTALAAMLAAAILAGGCAAGPVLARHRDWREETSAGRGQDASDARETTARATGKLRIDAKDVCVRLETIPGDSPSPEKDSGIEIDFRDELHETRVSQEGSETIVSLAGKPFAAGRRNVPIVVRVPSGVTETMTLAVKDAFAVIPTGRRVAAETLIECDDACLFVTSEDGFSGIGVDARLTGSFCVRPGETFRAGALSMGDSVFTHEGDSAKVDLSGDDSFVVFDDRGVLGRMSERWDEFAGDYSQIIEELETEAERAGDEFADEAGRKADELARRADEAADRVGIVAEEKAERLAEAAEIHAAGALSDIMRETANLLHAVGRGVGDLMAGVGDGIAGMFG